MWSPRFDQALYGQAVPSPVLDLLLQSKRDWASWAQSDEDLPLPAWKGAQDAVDEQSTSAESDRMSVDTDEGPRMHDLAKDAPTEGQPEPEPAGAAVAPKKGPKQKQKRARAEPKPCPTWWSLTAAPRETVEWVLHLEPKDLADAEQLAAQVEREQRCTLLVRNIPNRLSRAELCGTLDAMGLQNKYNLIWMPFDRTSLKWKGFCFIHFVSTSDAAVFCRQAPQIQFSAPHSTVTPSIANAQGTQDMLSRIDQSLESMMAETSEALQSCIVVRTDRGLQAVSPKEALRMQ